MGLLATLAILPAAARAVIAWWAEAMRAAILASAHVDPAAFDFAASGRAVVILAAPILVASAVTSAATTLVQTGGILAPHRISPDLSRLDPIAGFRRIFSSAALFGTLRAVTYGGLALAIAFFELRAHALDFAHLAGRADAIGPFALALVSKIWKAVALTGIAVAALDLVVANMLWRRRLRMTHDQIRRERRESDGDPQIRDARRRAFEELLASATRIEDASFVVTDEEKIAVALRYRRGIDSAPVVIASGSGILEAARAARIRVVRDVDLAAGLALLVLNATIPQSLYDRVAEHVAHDD